MAIQEAKQQHPDMLVTKAVVIRETESPTEELPHRAQVHLAFKGLKAKRVCARVITATASLCDCSHDRSCWILTLGERILRLCDQPRNAPSAGQEDSCLPSRFRDLFHEAVATSVPFFQSNCISDSCPGPSQPSTY